MSPVGAIKVVGISGSLRKGSYNSALLRAAAELLPDGMTLDVVDLAELPFYNNDVEQQGLPPGVQRFRERIAGADALLLAAPEYNFSISGVLKNALEWASRPPDPPMSGKPCALMGASVSPLGTARGQFHLRHVCVSLNAIALNTPHVDVTEARKKFDDAGRLIDQPSLDSIRQLLAELRTFTLRLRGETSAPVE
ncbi:MAG TPA: NADPH-dependent FMN reductase [Xanthobacteraceae bacterium]|jgi:chromate reductase